MNDRSGEAAAGAPAADRLHAGERRVLQIVGSRVVPGARELEQAVERRPRLDDLGLGGSAPAHRDDEDAPVAPGEQRGMTGDGGLSDPLARSR